MSSSTPTLRQVAADSILQRIIDLTAPETFVAADAATLTTLVQAYIALEPYGGLPFAPSNNYLNLGGVS